jgi:hypothetical protein
VSSETPPTATRRRFLAGSAALATGSLAGCVEALPPLGRRVAIGNVAPPDAGPPEYRSWVPTASAVPEASFSADDVLFAKPTSVQHVEEGFASWPRAVIESTIDWFGYGYDSYDRAMKMGGTYVLVGDIEPSTVADALASTGYEQTGSYEGYTLYRRADIPRTVAVKSGVILYAADIHAEDAMDDDSERTVKAVADTEAGRTERHHKSDADFALLTEKARDRPAAWLGPVALDPTETAVTGGITEVVEESKAYQLLYMVYPEGTEPPVRDIERAIEADQRSLVSDRSEVTAEGRVAVVEGVRDVTPVDDYSGPDWPQVTWGVGQEEATVTIRHEAGEEVDASKLAILTTAEGGDLQMTDAQFADRFDSVAPGDERTVSIGDATTQVVLEHRLTEYRKGRLLTYRVP